MATKKAKADAKPEKDAKPSDEKADTGGDRYVTIVAPLYRRNGKEYKQGDKIMTNAMMRKRLRKQKVIE